MLIRHAPWFENKENIVCCVEHREYMLGALNTPHVFSMCSRYSDHKHTKLIWSSLNGAPPSGAGPSSSRGSSVGCAGPPPASVGCAGPPPAVPGDGSNMPRVPAVMFALVRGPVSCEQSDVLELGPVASARSDVHADEGVGSR